jgi:hypothetical protein
MLLALLLLAGGGMASTVFAFLILYVIAWLSWPDRIAEQRIFWLGWLGMGGLALIAVVLTSYGFVLGRRAWKMKGPGGIEFEAEGGADVDEAPLAANRRTSP